MNPQRSEKRKMKNVDRTKSVSVLKIKLTPGYVDLLNINTYDKRPFAFNFFSLLKICSIHKVSRNFLTYSKTGRKM